jgi:hypothetical protein
MNTIWSKDSAKGAFFTVTLRLLYKDGEFWKRSHSFSAWEPESVGHVLDMERDWIAKNAAL